MGGEARLAARVASRLSYVGGPSKDSEFTLADLQDREDPVASLPTHGADLEHSLGKSV